MSHCPRRLCFSSSRRHLSYDDCLDDKTRQKEDNKTTSLSELCCAVLCMTVVHNGICTDVLFLCGLPVKNRGWWRWALVSLDGVVPSRMVCVSASVNFPLHHEVQKFASGTGSPGWSRKKGRKTVVVWYVKRLARKSVCFVSSGT